MNLKYPSENAWKIQPLVLSLLQPLFFQLLWSATTSETEVLWSVCPPSSPENPWLLCSCCPSSYPQSCGSSEPVLHCFWRLHALLVKIPKSISLAQNVPHAYSTACWTGPQFKYPYPSLLSLLVFVLSLSWQMASPHLVPWTRQKPGS